MAFPWDVILAANLATGEIVEDLKLGIELTSAGMPPSFCPQACVTSYFPTSLEAADTQRQRWEEGHLSMITKTLPHMVWKALLNRNLPLLVLCADLAVPPLSLLVLVIVFLLLISITIACLGAPRSILYLSTTAMFAVSAAVFLCWLNFGRDILPLQRLSTLPIHVFKKLRHYRRIFLGHHSRTEWIRTDRQNSRSP